MNYLAFCFAVVLSAFVVHVQCVDVDDCPDYMDRSGCWKECACSDLTNGKPCELICPEVAEEYPTPCGCEMTYFNDTESNECKKLGECAPQEPKVVPPVVVPPVVVPPVVVPPVVVPVVVPEECGDYQEHKDCGPACEDTCALKHESCTLQCVSGCFCEVGYVRSIKAGDCVKPEECPEN